MKFTPRPYQQAAIEHGISHPQSAWFVEMGLGKTAARLAVWNHLFADGAITGVLIVAPLRVAVLTWPDEVEKWDNFRWMRVADLRTETGKQAWRDGAAELYVINYELLPKFTLQFLKGKRAGEIPAQEVFFDESDNLKNPSSKRAKPFREFGRPKFARCGIQTGTPIPNNRLDLFAQMRLLTRGECWKSSLDPTGNSFKKWKHTYFQRVNHYGDFPKFELKPGAAELIEERIAPYALVQLAKDHRTWSPVVTHDIEVPLPPKAHKVYQTVEKKLLEVLEDGAEIIAVNAGALVSKLLQITGGTVYAQQGEDESTRCVQVIHDARIDALRKLHRDNGGKPMLVASWFVHERDRILAEVPRAEPFSNDRLQAWNRGEIPMIVAHPKSIGHGLNMQQSCHQVCWFSHWYSRGLYDQFNARVARQGQTEQAQVYRLISPGTVDDAVIAAIELKDKDQQAFLQTLKNIRRLTC